MPADSDPSSAWKLGEHNRRSLVATCQVYDGLYPRSSDSPLITVSGLTVSSGLPCRNFALSGFLLVVVFLVAMVFPLSRLVLQYCPHSIYRKREGFPDTQNYNLFHSGLSIGCREWL
jgi:hypothetical protein